jgi:hypothetical protein
MYLAMLHLFCELDIDVLGNATFDFAVDIDEINNATVNLYA